MVRVAMYSVVRVQCLHCEWRSRLLRASGRPSMADINEYLRMLDDTIEREHYHGPHHRDREFNIQILMQSGGIYNDECTDEEFCTVAIVQVVNNNIMPPQFPMNVRWAERVTE